MAWFTYSADIQVRGQGLLQVERDHACPLCYAKLQRLAWRELLPPYHWQPFGYICSTCNAVYVGADARLDRRKLKTKGYGPDEILERKEARKKPKAPNGAVQAP